MTHANLEPAGFPAYLATVRNLVWEGYGITLTFKARAETHACYEIGKTPAQCATLIGHTPSLRPG